MRVFSVAGCRVVGDLLPVAAVPVAFDPVGHRKRVCAAAFREMVTVSPCVCCRCLCLFDPAVCLGFCSGELWENYLSDTVAIVKRLLYNRTSRNGCGVIL